MEAPPRSFRSVETHVPAQHEEAEEDPRISGPQAHARRSRRPQEPAPEGKSTSRRLIWRVRDRATFWAFARGERHRAGALSLVKVEVPGSPTPPQLAFRIGRHVGNAVTRNRLRRRLRALVSERGPRLEGGHAYLVGAGPEAAMASGTELGAALDQLLEATEGAGGDGR